MVVPILYLLSAVCFILALKLLARVRTARRGNLLAAIGMLLAIVGTLLELGLIDYRWIILGCLVGGVLGAVAALRVPMTAMPEMVALLNGCGGAASALVALAYYFSQAVEPGRVGSPTEVLGGAQAIMVAASVLIGGVTFSGSLVAYAQLQGKILGGRPVLLPLRHVWNAALLLATLGLGGYFAFGAETIEGGQTLVLVETGASLVLGVLLVIPIGGADMPVVISLLNSYSGLAASATGFVIGNNVLIISGALVGASGIILSQIMCAAMNRSLPNVLLGGFGTAEASGGGEYKNVRSCTAEEAALVLESASSVIVVPGYGLAVAQAQHAVRELCELLERRGAQVRYAIHPVAGRMPGHMNVLLAEADVPYEQLVEMDKINPEFKHTDVVLVIGANDVVNPAALTDRSSPIWGMPILEVHNARSVFVIKRSLGAGYAGIKNELFERPNTMMIYGDAKRVVQDLIKELKQT
ncbi:MAG: NAD(P)(+) transhydrogenase (Re/Si-specific) subunit beta [Myxococcales bacterium]|nr:NAD(P)(+) transhydrogenase (Re/Si-specific) subunit beta [Myxococcales bacterium]